MITLITAPAANSYVAAAAPVWIQASSDADETAYTITGQADETGSVNLTTADTTGLIANNVILITGATGDYAYLNGRRNVVAVLSPTNFVIDLAYDAGATGGFGTATIQLEKFSMGVENQYDIDGNDFPISIHYPPFQNGTAQKDISRTICGIFQPEFDLTPGWHSELNKTFFTIETAVFEAALNAVYGRTVLDSEPFIWYAVQSTMITGRIIEAGFQNKLLNGTINYKARAGTKVIMSMLTTESDVAAYYLYNTGTVVDGYDDLTADQLKAYYVFTIPAGCPNVTLYIADSSDERISERITITVLPPACNAYILYWKNRYGGYDFYEFNEVNETNATGNRQEVRGYLTAMGNLIDKDFSTEKWEEVTLIGRSEPQQSVEYLRDLIVSPEIYNASGERVKILTSEFVTSARENVTPEFTILVNREAVIW